MKYFIFITLLTVNLQVTQLGPASQLRNQPERWHSHLQQDGSPIEFSWTWNTVSGGKPKVRYLIEPIGKFAGTELDPLNQQALRELLHSLATVVPSMDTTWSNYFWSTLYDHNSSKIYAQQQGTNAGWATITTLCTELTPQGPKFRTNFFPRKHNQKGVFLSLKEWEDTFAKLDPVNAARSSLHDFLASDAEGKLLRPLMVGVDNVNPTELHLEWFFVSPHTKFSSVREIMTLGGRVNLPGLNVQLADLYDLIKAVTDLPLDACETDEIRPVSNGNSDVRSPENGLEDILLHGNRYCFNITPGKIMPEIRMYLQLRLNGRDDSTIARGLVSWMEAHGRGAYCQAFLHMLRNGLGGHRRLDWSTGIQTSLACQFKDGELEVTSYLGPEAFHLGRMQKERPNGRRGTRRRDE